ncbi:hypothetical protein AB0M97_29650 [Streptomyces sp. NPDC051207]|uniref:hypothetical protein n=1 Tax=Streptomyces sp. NPDC051207 TaxID=3154641 RepID=UPI00342E679F
MKQAENHAGKPVRRRPGTRVPPRPLTAVRKALIVSARRALPALTAGAATGLVLLLRRAATRSWRGGRRHGASAARPPWRRTGAADRPAPTDRGPRAREDQEAAELVEEAEEHVYQYWQRLRAQQPPPD